MKKEIEIKKLFKILDKWFKEFMIDKIIRIDVGGITCLEDLKDRIKKVQAKNK